MQRILRKFGLIFLVVFLCNLAFHYFFGDAFDPVSLLWTSLAILGVVLVWGYFESRAGKQA